MIFSFWAPLAAMFARVAPTLGTAIGKGASANFTAILGRLALRGDSLGSAGRIGLARMVKGRGIELPEGTLGALAQDFLQLGKSLFKLPERLKDFGSALVQENRRLSSYSGIISSAMGQLEADRIRRDIASAKERASSTKFQAGAQSYLEEESRPVEDFFSNVKNYVVGGYQYYWGFQMKLLKESVLMPKRVLFDWPAAAGEAIGRKIGESLPINPDDIAMPPGDRERLRRGEVNFEELQEEWKKKSEEARRQIAERRKQQGDARKPIAPRIDPNAITKSDIQTNQLVMDIANGVYSGRKYPPLPKDEDRKSNPLRMGW